MNLSDLHRRLLHDVLAIGTPYPLVITGGYAVQAHGLVDRLSQDIDVATESPAPMADIANDLVRGLTERGWQVNVISVDSLAARLIVVSSDTGEECEVDVLKENLCAPATRTPFGPVLSLDDVIGTKVRAWQTARQPAISLTSAPPPAITQSRIWNSWGSDTAGDSSALTIFVTASALLSGSMTWSSRHTACLRKRSRTSDSGPSNGSATSSIDCTRP